MKKLFNGLTINGLVPTYDYTQPLIVSSKHAYNIILHFVARKQQRRLRNH